MAEIDYAALADQARKQAKPVVDYAALANQARQSTQQPSTNTGLAMSAGAKAVPAAARIATEVATNPNLPKIAAKVGRVVGGMAPVVLGAAKMGPAGAAIGLAGSAQGAWAGGKSGWFTGKLAQKVTAPVASVLTKVAPYMQALTTIGGVQSALDLHQILEPNRKDIGFMGIGPSVARTAEEEAAHPALINLAVSKLRDAFKALTDEGLSKEEATDILLASQGRAR